MLKGFDRVWASIAELPARQNVGILVWRVHVDAEFLEWSVKMELLIIGVDVMGQFLLDNTVGYGPRRCRLWTVWPEKPWIKWNIQGMFGNVETNLVLARNLQVTYLALTRNKIKFVQLSYLFSISIIHCDSIETLQPNRVWQYWELPQEVHKKWKEM